MASHGTSNTHQNASDNPTWDEAMNGFEKAGYWDAATKEYQTLLDKE